MRVFCQIWIQHVYGSEVLYAYLNDEEQYNLSTDLAACPDLTGARVEPIKVSIGPEILSKIGNAVSRAFVSNGRDVKGSY